VLKIEYDGQVIEIKGEIVSPIVVTISGIASKEIFHLQGETRKYILFATKDKKLVLN